MHWGESKGLVWIQIFECKMSLFVFWVPVFPSKTHFCEPGSSEKKSKCAHASVHMSSISSLSSLPPSLPPSISRPHLLENDLFHRPCTLTPSLTWSGSAQHGTVQLSGEGLDAASLPSQPAGPPSQPWHYLKEPQPKISDEEDAVLYCQFSTPFLPSSSLWEMYQELACHPSVTKTHRATFSHQGHHLIWRHSCSSCQIRGGLTGSLWH